MNINEIAVSELAKALSVEPDALKQHLGYTGTEAPKETKIGELLSGYTIMPKTAYETFIDNLGKTKYDDGRKAAIGIPVQLLNEQLFGEKKEFRFEKYEDAAAQAKAIAEAYAEKKLKENGQEPDKRITALNSDLETLRNQLKAKEDEIKAAAQKITEVEQFSSVNMQVIAAAAGIDLAAADDKTLSQQREVIGNLFHQKYKVETIDGKTVVIDRATGQARKNNLLEPVSVKDVVEEIATIFPKKSTPSGRGDGSNGGGGGADKPLKGMSQQDIMAHLAAKGLDLVGEEGKAIYREWMKQNPKT